MGYGVSRGGFQIIGGFWAYAGLLEYLQHFSPSRHPTAPPIYAERPSPTLSPSVKLASSVATSGTAKRSDDIIVVIEDKGHPQSI
jgi:hypothetical protein